MTDHVPMPSTIWRQIDKARAGNAKELDRLLEKYRPPVLSFVRNALRDQEEAEDVAQEVLVAVVQDDVLAKADPARGRFRSLLLAVTRHVLSMKRRSESTQRRGGGRKALSLGPAADSAELPLQDILAAPEKGRDFDPLWVEDQVLRAMRLLEDECRRTGTRYFSALQIHVLRGWGYPQIAEGLGVSVTDIKNYIHQARVRLRRLVLQEIETADASSHIEHEAEISYLMHYLV